MKYLPLLIVACFFSTEITAQILNPQINAEVRIAEFYGNSDNDATSTDEQSMLINAKFEDIIAPFDYPTECVLFDCFVPCTQAEDIAAGISYSAWIGGWEYDATVDFQLHAWGSEDSDRCSFDAGDEDEFQGLASDYNLTNASITNNREPIRWYTDLGSTDGWIFDNSNLFNLKPQLIWSYSNGGSCNQPLSFGTISSGQTKSHINTNRSVPGELLGDAVIGYTNLNSDFNDSPEAYYSFTLAETAMVTISTDTPGTDYDTFLGLLAPSCGDLITTNDDYTNENYSSRIVSQLEAGTYTVFVEGYSTDQGDFELSISADAVVGTNEINTELPITIGPNPTDGLVKLMIGEPILLNDAVVEVVNLQAQVLLKTNLNSTVHTIDLSSYPAGTYLLRVISPEGQLTEKILVY